MIGLVWAQAANGVIGRDGQLPWRLPEDLAHFRRLTSGSSVVMGRRTWESLPEAVRPLPGRRNVVLSRDPDAVFPGAERAGSLPAALAGPGTTWVIGGASVYAAALVSADQVVITELEQDFAGDTYAPDLGATWVPDAPAGGWLTSTSGLRYRVRRYRPALRDG